MGIHQKAFVKMRVLIAPQLTLPRVQIGCSWMLGELLWNCTACGSSFLCAVTQRFSSTITSRTAGVRSVDERAYRTPGPYRQDVMMAEAIFPESL